ncbi:ATP-binding cassette domain-containing protein [Leptospira sp. GIMC2001]|uniref:ATP-binding cassette domain-containing protein n=1 Tax=Leptospira sp. GIMC2001 TaxID=1513297 RepID=UPI00234B3ACE|nr:ATP-binding cassette domain-containing protein [Leptospira sp. GIMC2001]WCL50063.1 ATP-binding cassette domain-containing protein [Leptospira sp. GIMC2001]
MLSIQLEQLYFPDTSDVLLHGIECNFIPGWTGIIGPNGSGKTLLAKTIAGLYSNYRGYIRGISSNYYLQQIDSIDTDEFYEFLCDSSSPSGIIKSKLDINWSHFEKIDCLSFGEKRRIQIGIALFLNPPLLILDEPTNHLDEYSRIIIQKALIDYTGVGILISHDRELLNFLVYQIYILKEGTGKVYSGNYSNYLILSQNERIRSNKEWEIAKYNHDRLSKEYSRRKIIASQAIQKRSGSKLDKNDNDGRAKLGLAIVSGKDGKAGKIKSQMDKKLEDSLLTLKKARGNLSKPELFYQPEQDDHQKNQSILNLAKQNLNLEYMNINIPPIHLTSSSRLGIRGRNGSGKSTLLNFIYDQCKNKFNQKPGNREEMFDEKEIYYMRQVMNAKEKQELIEKITNLPNFIKSEFNSIVHFFQMDAVNRKILSELSPGQWKKLEISWGILTKPKIWILDEPTNYLDIFTLESIERMFSNWDKSLIVVSHDLTFLEKVCTEVIEIK